MFIDDLYAILQANTFDFYYSLLSWVEMKKVLLADDKEDIRDILKDFLSEEGYDVDLCSDGGEALEKAQPHWSKSESLSNEATDLNEHLKERRSAIKAEKKKAERKKLEDQLEAEESRLELLTQQSRDEQAAGDSHYWPIFDLDIKNPNAPEAEVHDPEELLVKYKKLLGEISDTEKNLKDELAAALSNRPAVGGNE